MKVACLGGAALILFACCPALAQDQPAEAAGLAELIQEAQKNNTQLVAAEHAWRAAGHVARQVTTLPDPQFTAQQFSVGSPKPKFVTKEAETDLTHLESIQAIAESALHSRLN